MADSTSLLNCLIAGGLRREFILSESGKVWLDLPGGDLLYAAAGYGVWNYGNAGLIGRVGEDFPQDWLDQLARRGFDRRGVAVLPQPIDLRYFASHLGGFRHNDNPVGYFAHLGLPFPKTLLGYKEILESSPELAIRRADIPPDYLDASAALLCPSSWENHNNLVGAIRHGRIASVLLDPGSEYMNVNYFNQLPALTNELTAFLVSEEKALNLFQGHSTDLWAIAEAIAAWDCELVVIKRGPAGQYLYETASKTHWVIPAYPIQASERDGAGASFDGGFLAGYKQTFSPVEAVIHGAISASLTVEGSGAFYCLDALPGLAQARLERLREMVFKV